MFQLPMSNFSHSLPIGPIVGGAVGGLAVLAAFIIALLFYRKRQSSQNTAMLNPQLRHPGLEKRTTPFNPPSELHSSHQPSSVDYIPYTTSSTFSVPTSGYNDRRTNSYHPSVSSGRTHSSTSGLLPGGTPRTPNDPTTDMQMFAVTNPVSRAPSYTAGSFSLGSSRHLEPQSIGSSTPPFITRSPTPSITNRDSRDLTLERINNLRDSYVPPAEIARVMEVMRGQREADLGGGSSLVDPILEEGSPPVYDFKSPD